MEITFKIEDYLTPEEMKEIAAEKFKASINSDPERILSNLAYYVSYAFVDKFLTDEQQEHLRKKVLECVWNANDHHVYRKDRWNGEKDSIACQVVDKVVRENSKVIEEKVMETLTTFDYEKHLSDDLMGILEGAIIRKLQEIGKK